jgi:hypothetical protein
MQGFFLSLAQKDRLEALLFQQVKYVGDGK